MSQVQYVAPLFGLGDATTMPTVLVPWTQFGLQLPTGADSDSIAAVIYKSTAVYLGLGALAGAAAGYFFSRNRKRAWKTGAMLGAGAASAFTTLVFWPNMPLLDSTGATTMRQYEGYGMWGLTAGLLGWGAYRAVR